MVEPITITEYPNNEWFEKCRTEGKSEVFYLLPMPHSEIMVIALIDTVESAWTRYYFKFAVITAKSSYWLD